MISRRAKRVTLGLAFGFLALLVFIILLNRHFAAIELRQRLEEERAEIREPEPLVHVVALDTDIRSRAFSARLLPWNDTRVAAEVSGRIDAITVEPGERVEEGAALVRLDDTLARLRLRSAEAAVESARSQLREFQRQADEAARLIESRAAPESRLLEARSRVEVQESELERLETEKAQAAESLRRHTVTAPFSGVAGERLVEIGDSVSAFQPVQRLAALDPLRVVFFVGEHEIAHLAPGSPIELRLSGAADSLPLEITSLAPVADRRTGSLRAEARLPNPDLALRGGIPGVVTAVIAAYPDRLFVPGTAVRYEGPRAFVDRIDEEPDTVTPVEVELGPEIRGRYPVLSGLNEGDRILVR